MLAHAKKKSTACTRLPKNLTKSYWPCKYQKTKMSHIFSALKLSYLADVQDVVEESVIVFGLLNKLKGQRMRRTFQLTS